MDTPPGAKQEAVLGQAPSSLRGLHDAAQPGVPAVQLLPPEPQVLAHALLSGHIKGLYLKPKPWRALLSPARKSATCLAARPAAVKRTGVRCSK